MPVRRKKKVTPTRFRPPRPPELGVYRPADWGAPPLDGIGPEWEAGHRAAYVRFEQACRDWFGEHGHLPVDRQQSRSMSRSTGPTFDYTLTDRITRARISEWPHVHSSPELLAQPDAFPALAIDVLVY